MFFYNSESHYHGREGAANGCIVALYSTQLHGEAVKWDGKKMKFLETTSRLSVVLKYARLFKQHLFELFCCERVSVAQGKGANA